MELVIKDVPEDKGIQEEIISNAMAIIARHIREQVPISKEQTDAEVAIQAIRDKNIMAVTEPLEG